MSIRSQFSNSISQNSTSDSSINTSIFKSSVSSNDNSLQINSDSVSSKQLSFWNFVFGSISVSAGENDYSWPWKNGETWTVGSKNWHPGDFTGSDGGTNINNALDVLVPDSYKEKNQYNQWTGKFYNTQVLSPKKGTMQRMCVGLNNSSVVIDNMRIVHLANNGFASKDGVSVNKNEFLSNVALGTNNDGVFGDSCGYSNYPHLHLKFISNNMVIDGTTVNHGTSYSSFTSQNQGTPPKPATFNNFNGSINFGGWQMDVQNAGNVAGDGTYRGTPVQIRYSPNVTNNAQRWFYDQQGKEIKGMNDYCLDAGDSQGRLVIWTCNGTANQKWTFYSSGLIKNQQTNQCIAIPGGQPNAVLGFSPCGSTGYQQWSRSNITLPNKVYFRRENTNQCMASYSPYSGKTITTQDCNSGDESQQWEWMYSGVGFVARKFGTNFCMDVYNPVSNKAIQVYDCNWTDSQKWWYNSNKLLSRAGTLSNNQCVAKWMPNNGQGINSWNCDSTDQNQRWDTWNV